MNLPIAIKQIIAFTKRDFYSWSTYRTAAITQIISIFIGVFSWGVGAAYVNRQVPEMYGGSDYISFLIVGIAVGNLIMPLIQGVERQLNPWTLETILMTDIKTPVFVLGNIMWTYIFSIISFIPYLVIGIYVFGAKLNTNIVATLISFIISFGILMGLAMISTGVRIVTKSTDPLTWAINVLQNLFSGIAFPVTYLDTIFFPGASTISWFLPQTWVYHLCRLSMLTNTNLMDPNIQIAFLKGAIFAVVLLPLGYKVFWWGVNRSKREGTLGWY
jgi:ABC-2 type transport system permease protein